MNIKPNAILVCVDYGDFLRLTLPYNRHHFNRVMIVTSYADHETAVICDQARVECFRTNAFYDNGAAFNKWKALEEGLNVLLHDGKTEWIYIMDADIALPKEINWDPVKGNLYTPERLICVEGQMTMLPNEADWPKYTEIHEAEFAGYSQLFHVDDPSLPIRPWHQTNWKHAGGADSWFQNLWPRQNKVRPPFKVLHLGPMRQNWAGRCTHRIDDGSISDQWYERKETLQDFLAVRRSKGRSSDRYDHERLGH